MRYELNRQYASKTDSLPIEENDFKRICSSQVMLASLYRMTESYSVVLESYKKIETEKFSLELDTILHDYTSYHNLSAARIKLNAPICGFLSTARFFVESSKTVLKDCVSDEAANNLSMLIKEIFDTCMEYRFICALRNYVQHCELPIHTYNVNQKWDSDNPNDTQVATTVTLQIHKKFLRKSTFKGKVLEEIPETIDLIYAIRTYLSKIYEIYRFCCNAADANAKENRKFIENIMNTYVKQTKLPNTCLVANAINDKEEIVESKDVFLDWDDTRLKIMGALSNLSKLDRLYITGKIISKNS